MTLITFSYNFLPQSENFNNLSIVFREENTTKRQKGLRYHIFRCGSTCFGINVLSGNYSQKFKHDKIFF